LSSPLPDPNQNSETATETGVMSTPAIENVLSSNNKETNESTTEISQQNQDQAPQSSATDMKNVVPWTNFQIYRSRCQYLMSVRVMLFLFHLLLVFATFGNKLLTNAFGATGLSFSLTKDWACMTHQDDQDSDVNQMKATVLQTFCKTIGNLTTIEDGLEMTYFRYKSVAPFVALLVSSIVSSLIIEYCICYRCGYPTKKSVEEWLKTKNEKKRKKRELTTDKSNESDNLVESGATSLLTAAPESEGPSSEVVKQHLEELKKAYNQLSRHCQEFKFLLVHLVALFLVSCIFTLQNPDTPGPFSRILSHYAFHPLHTSTTNYSNAPFASYSNTSFASYSNFMLRYQKHFMCHLMLPTGAINLTAVRDSPHNDSIRKATFQQPLKTPCIDPFNDVYGLTIFAATWLLEILFLHIVFELLKVSFEMAKEAKLLSYLRPKLCCICLNFIPSLKKCNSDPMKEQQTEEKAVHYSWAAIFKLNWHRFHKAVSSTWGGRQQQCE